MPASFVLPARNVTRAARSRKSLIAGAPNVLSTVPPGAGCPLCAPTVTVAGAERWKATLTVVCTVLELPAASLTVKLIW